MKIALVFVTAACLSGCVPDKQDLRPLVAVSGAYGLATSVQPPAPENDNCENCRGTGKVGDGRVFAVCPVCNGSGKKIKSVCVSGCKK